MNCSTIQGSYSLSICSGRSGSIISFRLTCSIRVKQLATKPNFSHKSSLSNRSVKASQRFKPIQKCTTGCVYSRSTKLSRVSRTLMKKITLSLSDLSSKSALLWSVSTSIKSLGICLSGLLIRRTTSGMLSIISRQRLGFKVEISSKRRLKSFCPLKLPKTSRPNLT